MRNYKGNNDNRYQVKPVKKVELSKQNIAIRIVLFIVLLLLGVSLIAYGINSLLTLDDGLYKINASINGFHVGNELTFYYNLGEKDISATKENKMVNVVYSDLVLNATHIFEDVEVNDSYKDYHGLSYINSHLNQDIELPKELYDALIMFNKYSDNKVYFAPIYDEYYDAIYAGSDEYAFNRDPNKNSEEKAHINKLLEFINDKAHINLVFKKNNTINLFVSDEYQEFFKEYGYTKYITLGNYKNAFVIDFIANGLKEKGYDSGFIYSNDGYFRGLNDTSYVNFNILDKDDSEKIDDIFSVGEFKTENSIAICSHQKYNYEDNKGFYKYNDGTIISKHVNNDGLNIFCSNNFINYGYKMSCSEIAFKSYNVYLNEFINIESVASLKSEKIYSVILDNSNILYNQDGLKIENIFDNKTIKYEVVSLNG